MPELTVGQIDEQLALAVDRVMSEGALYDRYLAALAIKQARGDLVEAIFLLRAHRTTLPRFGISRPLDTARMLARRRISATFKDVPGGQLLGPTFDYTHRLLDFSLAASAAPALETNGTGHHEAAKSGELPRVIALLGKEGLIEPEVPDAADRPVPDLTRAPLTFPAARDARLQSLARGDEGFLLALGYSTQRGYGRNHPFAGEIRIGEVDVEIEPAELGFAVSIADITVTECEMVNQFTGSAVAPPQFTRGYGLAFGEAERKAMAMALVDRALHAPELGEDVTAPAQDAEFVLYHGWGTGGIQVTASVIGPDDVLKVIDQGADDTTNAVCIRRFFARTAGVRTTTRTVEATLIQTRHRIPETPLDARQIVVFQVPIPEPLRWLEPRESETRVMHALEDYGVCM